ncbi:MAG TPA: hypothetical protein VFY84_19790 [Jiangellales bacterium]|nr:hypothetical protein [Jiangellales bacterium]
MTRRNALVKHRFVPSGRRSYGHRICATCDSLEHHSVHKVREVTEEELEEEVRRVGDR